MKKPLWEDTHPEIERRMIEAYRRMTPREKMAHVVRLNRLGHQAAMADVRRRYPEADERECALRVASRYISADLMRNAFGWDPDEKGF